MKSIAKEMALVVRDDNQWERVVFAEVLVPEVPNVFGDYWTRASIKHAAYLFMMQGFGIDVEHDNSNIDGLGAVVVESFIVRPGDPDFIEGSWVVGMKILDDVLWDGVLSGEINGYSYEALVEFFSGFIVVTDDGIRQGVTEPSLEDGHTHEFVVLVDENNRPVDGGTSVTDGHSHTITVHSTTGKTNGHLHRYNLVTGKDGH